MKTSRRPEYVAVSPLALDLFVAACVAVPVLMFGFGLWLALTAP